MLRWHLAVMPPTAEVQLRLVLKLSDLFYLFNFIFFLQYWSWQIVFSSVFPDWACVIFLLMYAFISFYFLLYWMYACMYLFMATIFKKGSFHVNLTRGPRLKFLIVSIFFFWRKIDKYSQQHFFTWDSEPIKNGKSTSLHVCN